jgi:CMP-N,N'-diacetyllegionaminic acid synthase
MKSRKIVTICARSGSKGVKGKNLLILGGKTLIEHAICQALECFDRNEIYFSSDSKQYIDIAASYGLNALLRDADLSDDKVGKIDVIKDIVVRSGLPVDLDTKIIDIDVSAPIRRKWDIEQCLKLSMLHKGVITGVIARKNPYYNVVECPNGYPELVKARTLFKTRQSCPKVFDMNASIYVWTRELLFSDEPFFSKSTALHEMPSFTSFDIDEDMDVHIVQALFKMYRSELGFKYLGSSI